MQENEECPRGRWVFKKPNNFNCTQPKSQRMREESDEADETQHLYQKLKQSGVEIKLHKEVIDVLKKEIKTLVGYGWIKRIDELTVSKGAVDR